MMKTMNKTKQQGFPNQKKTKNLLSELNILIANVITNDDDASAWNRLSQRLETIFKKTDKQNIDVYSKITNIFLRQPVQVPQQQMQTLKPKRSTKLGLVQLLYSCAQKYNIEHIILLQTTSSGFTPLQQILKMGDNELLILYDQLLNTALRMSKIEISDIKRLYLESNKHGFTSFHQALANGGVETFGHFMQMMRDIHMSEFEYREMVQQRHPQGFSVLHLVFQSRSSAKFQILMDFLKQKLCEEELTQLLIGRNDAGFTPLHDALSSENPELCKEYINLVHHAVLSKFISSNQYKSLLLHPNDAGISPFQQALIKKNDSKCLHVYLDALHQAITDGIVMSHEYTTMLLFYDTGGFSPLHDVLRAGDVGIAQHYVGELLRCHQPAFIGCMELKHLLLDTNNAGFSTLLQCIKTGSPAILNIWCDFADTLRDDPMLDFTNEEYVHLLTMPNHAGFTPLIQACMDGQNCLQKYLEILDSCIAKGYVSVQNHCEILLHSNEAGFSCLHELLRNKAKLRYIHLVMQRIESLVKDKFISASRFASFLLDANRFGYSTIDQAVNANYTDALELLLRSIQTYCTSQAYEKALFRVNHPNPSPSNNQSQGRRNSRNLR